jgi:hypothetical protein
MKQAYESMNEDVLLIQRISDCDVGRYIKSFGRDWHHVLHPCQRNESVSAAPVLTRMVRSTNMTVVPGCHMLSRLYGFVDRGMYQTLKLAHLHLLDLLPYYCVRR